MDDPIPVSIAALHLTKSSLTHSFMSKPWSRSWYDPSSPLLPICCSNHYLYINLMYFSAHFTGIHRCAALDSLFFLSLLIPCLSSPVFLKNLLSHPPPNHTPTNYSPHPTISLNAPTHQPPTPSYQFFQPTSACVLVSPNPPPTTHKPPKSSLIFMSHPISPYLALISITALNLSYP